jgi:sigma-B regulation protein RsbU (phosphoserine phosphatase)
MSGAQEGTAGLPKVKGAMALRDALLFAATGWDPTWQRQLSDRARAVWATAVSVLSAIFGAAALLAWLHLDPDQRWMPFALAGLWLVSVGGVQVLVRREVLRRIDVEADQIAAREIQVRLLPLDLPAAEGLELAAHYAPMREIGGDFYEVAPFGDGQWLIAMADVCGKGAGAALLTANLQALVHFAHANAPSLEATMSAINSHLVRFSPPDRFATMVLGIFDVDRRRLRYINAGHNPPLVMTASGDAVRLSPTGLPLGMLPDSTYSASEIDLPPGTTCLFYTDGLVERANRSDDFYDEDRVVAALRGVSGATAGEMLKALVADADRFARGVEPADDVALLLLRSY